MLLLQNSHCFALILDKESKSLLFYFCIFARLFTSELQGPVVQSPGLEFNHCFRFYIATCPFLSKLRKPDCSGASAISEGDIFIYSCSAQLISVEIESTSLEVDSISKEINCAEHEYMNLSPSLIALAPPLKPELLDMQRNIYNLVDKLQ